MYKLKIKLFFLLSVFFLFAGVLFAASIEEKLKQAEALTAAAKHQEAMDVYEDILAAEPHNQRVLYSAALASFNIGRADMAHTYLRRILMNNDKDADVYNLFGLANERTGYKDSAISNYTHAISLDSNLYEAYFNRGRCYSIVRKMDAARADYKKAKQNKTIFPELYYASGELYYYLQQYDSALIDFETIISYETSNYKYFAMLGDCYHALWPKDSTKLEKAVEYYSKALKLKEEETTVLQGRAAAYEKLKQYEQATADREKIRAIQAKTGINPQMLSYKQMVQPNKLFSMAVPTTWKAVMKITPSEETVLLYDSTLIKGDTIPEGYVFEYGCEVKFYKNVFKYDSNDINAALVLRDAKFNEWLIERANNLKTNALKYVEVSRKHFNPTEDIAKEIKKMSLNVTYSAVRFFRTEFFCVTTTGHMLWISLWVPDEQSLYYEALLDHIIGTITIPAEVAAAK